jgi:hypothetical protein
MAIKFPGRRFFTGAAITVVAVVALGGIASTGESDVTKARLERSLPASFANLYVQQAELLGHTGITTASLHAKTSCDKGGPKVADHGPGADWICLMSWTDPNVPLPDGYAKFDLNVHSNDCYTAGGQTKYVGLITITDKRGKDVDNPIFEFDTCFDPKSSNRPTGVTMTKPASSKLTPTQQVQQSAFVTLPTGTMAATADGTIAPSLVCSPGHDGCAGTVTVQAGAHRATTKYVIGPDDPQPLTLPLPKGTTGRVTLTATPVIGRAPKPTSTITLVARG